MNHSEIIEKLNWRYAVKKFDGTKKLSTEQWQTIEDSLVLTPSSYGLQPWKFIVVQDQELKKKLRSHSWNQSQVEDCSHFLIFTVLKEVSSDYVAKYVDNIVETRGVPRDSLAEYEKMMVDNVVTSFSPQKATEWASRQAYIALGQAMMTAAMIQVDACPMEGISPSDYDEILGLKDGDYQTVVALAFGFRAEDDYLNGAKKVRFKNEQVIDHR